MCLLIHCSPLIHTFAWKYRRIATNGLNKIQRTLRNLVDNWQVYLVYVFHRKSVICHFAVLKSLKFSTYKRGLLFLLFEGRISQSNCVFACSFVLVR